MWIKAGDLGLFVKTAEEGDYTWEFDGETHQIFHHNREVFASTRYSLTIRELSKLMPKLYDARIAWLERSKPMNSALREVKQNVD